MNRWQLRLDTFMRPHNSHLSIVPAVVFFFLFRLIGLENYGVYQLAGYFTHIFVASLFLILTVRRIGRTAAIALGASFLFLGTGAENILWPFQIGAMMSVAGYLLALILLDIDTSRRKFFASIALILSLGSAGFGIAAIIGVTVELTLAKRLRKSWWVVMTPTVLWLFWYSIYGTSEIQTENLHLVFRYINESLAGGLANYVHLSIGWGFIFEIFFAITALYLLIVKRSGTPRMIGLAFAIGTFWFFTALARAQYWAPQGMRYMYFAIIIILLIGVEFAHKIEKPQLITATILISIWSITSTWDAMDSHALFLREWSTMVRAELSALEANQENADPKYRPDPTRAPDITARKYFAAIHALESSPAQDPSTLSTSRASARMEIDRVLLETGAVVISPPRELAGDCSTELELSDFVILPAATVTIASPDGEIEIGFKSFGDTPSAILRTHIPAGFGLKVTSTVSIQGEQWTITSLTSGRRVCFVQDSN